MCRMEQALTKETLFKRRIYRRLCTLLHRLYILRKYYDKYIGKSLRGHCGKYSDGGINAWGTFKFNKDKLIVDCIDSSSDYNINFRIYNLKDEKILTLKLERHSLTGEINFDFNTTYSKAKDAYKLFKNIEKAVDKELKEYYNLDIQNENLHDDFENLIGAF